MTGRIQGTGSISDDEVDMALERRSRIKGGRTYCKSRIRSNRIGNLKYGHSNRNAPEKVDAQRVSEGGGKVNRQ